MWRACTCGPGTSPRSARHRTRPYRKEILLRTLILGLADRESDPGRVGIEVAKGLHAVLADPDVDYIEARASGVALLEIAAGYDKVVVVDCIGGGGADVGELQRLGLSGLELTPRVGPSGNPEYRATVQLPGGAVNAPLEISVYAIDVGAGGGSAVADNRVVREAVPRLIAQIAREEFGARAPGGDWG